MFLYPNQILDSKKIKVFNISNDEENKNIISALNLYTKGKISKEEFENVSRSLGINNMANAYLDTQEVSVQDFKL